MKASVGISRIRNREIVFVILLFFTLPIGCSNLPISRTEIAGEVPYTVGVVSARFLPVVKLDMPPTDKFSGAVLGAGSGFKAWAKVPADFLIGGPPGAGTEQGAYLTVVILAVAAVAGSVGGIVGGIRGALHSPTPEEAAISEAETRNSFRNLKIQETMRDHVINASGAQNRFRLVAPQDACPNEPEQECDYRSFSERGIDTVEVCSYEKTTK